MKKKYEIPKENPEKDMVNEPAIEYGKKSSIISSCQYSTEELRERVVIATKHVEEGKYYTDEELDDFILS